MSTRDEDRFDLEDPLGIAREPVSHDPLIHADDDEASRKRRRERALGPKVDERRSTGTDEHDGASGIDMGYGGDGTDIKP